MIWRSAAPFVVGHRGGRGEGWPAENTLAAFERAAREGARAVELDVRTTADAAVVVFHDRDLARMTGHSRTDLVARLSARELAGVKLADDMQIPHLDEALTWARHCGIAVNIELKHDVPSRLTLACAVARIVRDHGGDIVLSSFDPAILAAMAILLPRVPRAALTHAEAGLSSALMQGFCRAPAAFAIHAQCTEITAARVARWRQQGLRVGAWTVNTLEEATRLLACGVDYLITDDPAGVGMRVSRD